jgi:hypothetical protein
VLSGRVLKGGEGRIPGTSIAAPLLAGTAAAAAWLDDDTCGGEGPEAAEVGTPESGRSGDAKDDDDEGWAMATLWDRGY